MNDNRYAWGYPQDDVEFTYYILQHCKLGIPIPRLCVLLEFRSNDFISAWEILRRVQKKYDVKVVKWMRGGATCVALKEEDSLTSYYSTVYLFRKRMGSYKESLGKAPDPKEEARKTKKVFKPGVYTIAELVKITGYSRQGVRKVIDRLVGVGEAVILNKGTPGGHNPMKVRIKKDPSP